MRFGRIGRFLWAPLMAFALGGCVSKEEAFKDLPLGKKVSNPFSIGDVQVPLPEGEWVVTGRRLNQGRATAGTTAPATFVQVFLTNVRDGIFHGNVWINTIVDIGTISYFVPFRECSREDMFFRGKDELPQVSSQFCWWINHGRFPSVDEFSDRDDIREMMDGFRSANIVLPGNTLESGFKMAVWPKYLWVNYEWNPEIDGIARSANMDWPSSDWHKDRIHQFPDKQQYAEKLKAWAADWRVKIKKGFNKQLQ